jgi:predicted permease
MVDAMVVPLREQMTAAAEPALKMLFGASILLLVIACINVSSLWLARSESRRRELSVQLAIGASRFRIARQLFGEAVVLTVIAGLLGALLATWAIQVLIALEPGGLPRVDAIAIDWTVLGFGFGVTMATALALAWITLRRGSAPDVREALATGWRAAADPRSARTREILVAGQVALTLVLLAGSALLIRSFTAVQAVDPGFRLDDALVVDITLNTANADGARVKQIQFQDELLARLKRLPGVVDAGLVSSFPLGGGGYPNGRFLEMTHVDEIQSPADVEKLGAEVAKRAGNAGYRVVSDGYFAAMGIPVVRGRTFDDRDAAAAPHAAIVSEAFVASRWPDRDPIGRFVQFGNMDGDPRGFTIVGVVGDVREVTTEAPPGPLFYVSHRQRPRFASRSTVVVRGPEPAAISPTVQRIIRDLDPALPVVVRTMTGAMDRTLSGRRFSLTLIAVFGCAALALATLGTYALIAFVVAQRAREMGIRIALGARPADLLRLIVGKGARLGLAGAGVGLAAAFGLTRLLQGMLFGVEPGDFVSHAVVVTLTLVAVLLASYIPARRVTRTDPSTSLRAL